MTAEPRVILISGCSTGIGRAAAIHFAKRGWRVYAGVRREDDRASLTRDDATIRPLILDVTVLDHVERAIDAIRTDAGGRLDALVNNAAQVLIGPVETTPIDDFRRLLEVNVLGMASLTQNALPLLRGTAERQGRAHIVNVGSTSGIVAWPFSGAYVASKFALEGWSDSLRLELAGTGVDVSVIITGSVRTPIWDKTHASFDRSEKAMSPEVASVYAERFEAARRAVRSSPDTIEPDRIVAAIEHAMASRRPRTRYVVGPSARKQRLLRRLLPDRLADRVRLAMIAKRAGRADGASADRH